MDGELKKLVRASWESELDAGSIKAFCARHEIESSQFAVEFAKRLALDFAYGEISYSEADCAINYLAGYMGPELAALPLEIHQAFDSGEYRRRSDPAMVIPWQRYTLPAIMNILAREQWLPRAEQFVQGGRFRRCLTQALAPLNQADRPNKPFTDPMTASVVGGLSLVLAAGGLFVGSRALVTGCVGLMRGRHGPSVQHCAPETSYWIATGLSLLLGIVLVAVGWKFLQLARSRRGAPAPRR